MPLLVIIIVNLSNLIVTIFLYIKNNYIIIEQYNN